MRTFLISLLFLTSVGCAHYKLVGYDKEANTVSIQCGKFGNEYEAQQQAEGICGSKTKLIRYGQTVGNTGMMVNGIMAMPKKNVYTFACLGE